MTVLGIESSCDECSVALVEDGKRILSNVIATQIEFHRPYDGVVPEIASRKHTEWIRDVYDRALSEAGTESSGIDGIAVTNRPGLVGSLLVGVSFAKALAFSLDVPLVGIDHVRAHLYAPQLERDIPYPFLGLLVSGGHTMICIVEDYDRFSVLGTTIDDACGEAFDKVAKHYGFGFPGRHRHRPAVPRGRFPRVRVSHAVAAQGRPSLRCLVLRAQDGGDQPARPVPQDRKGKRAPRISRPRSRKRRSTFCSPGCFSR